MFNDLVKIDVNEHIEKKGKFSYLSWPFAWSEIKKIDPLATYRVIDGADGLPFFNAGDAGAFVKVGVTVKGLEHVETFPVLNHSNRPIPGHKVTSFDINTSIKRAMVKAIALHGLGLYIYQGEDLPVDAPKSKTKAPAIRPAPVTEVPF